MRLCTWAYSMRISGVRSAANGQFLDGHHRHGSVGAMPDTTITVNYRMGQSAHCMRTQCHPSGVRLERYQGNPVPVLNIRIPGDRQSGAK
jgi:hypothetical protein